MPSATKPKSVSRRPHNSGGSARKLLTPAQQSALNAIDDDELTPAQIAAVEGVSVEAVNDWCRKGAIGFRIKGRRNRLISKADYLAFKLANQAG